MRFLLLLLAVFYAISPYDLFPDMIVGFGWIDDLIVLFLAWVYFNKYRKKGIRGSSSPNDSEKQSDNGYEGKGDENSNSDSLKDPYAVLGISRKASSGEIKNAYRQLVNQYHPDKVSYLGVEFRELAEKRFREINKAYQELTSK